MRIGFHFIQLLLIFILFSSCGDVLSDYDIDNTNPLDIDNEICAVLNESQAVSAHIFLNNDSLTNENLYSLHSMDSNLFVSLSNDHSWRIAIDSTSYFMGPRSSIEIELCLEFILFTEPIMKRAPVKRHNFTKSITICSFE